MGRVTARRGVLRISDGVRVRRPDTLAAEEPLEIRVDKRALAVTMRTPGDDVDLALGFLLTEGVIRAPEDVRTAILCAGDQAPNTYNVVDVVLAPGVPAPDTDPTRAFYTTSSCGVCGKASIDAVRTRSAYPVGADPVTVSPSVLSGHVLLVSGRASFELTQKASMAGIPILAAVSAPSTLAVELADEVGLTVVGFLRGTTMNVYSRPDRIA